MNNSPKLRKARPADANAIRDLINGYAEQGLMLPRSLSALYDAIRNFWIVEEDGRLIGCAALNICWEDMAEIRSLAVAESHRKSGLGRILLDACLEEARQYGIGKVFTLTYVKDFFLKFGFREISKDRLPHKIWKDCLNCPHFPDCREVAMLRELPPGN